MYKKMISCVLVIALVISLSVTASAEAMSMPTEAPLAELFSAVAETPAPQAPPVTLTIHEAVFLSLTNIERKRAGVAPLAIDPVLVQAARIRAEEISRLFCFGHTRPSGATWCTVLFEVGYEHWHFASENLAFGPDASTHDAVRALMDSPGHRDAMLSDAFNIVGVAVFQVENVTHWVQIFSHDSPPSFADIIAQAIAEALDAQPDFEA